MGVDNLPLEPFFRRINGSRAVTMAFLDPVPPNRPAETIIFESEGELRTYFYNPSGRGFVDGALISPRASPVFAAGNLDTDPRGDVLFTNEDGTFVAFNTRWDLPPTKLDSRQASHLAIADLDNDGRGNAIASFRGQGVFVRFGARFQLIRAGTVESLTPCDCLPEPLPGG